MNNRKGRRSLGKLYVQPKKNARRSPAMGSLLELFVIVDDFCQVFLPFWERKLMQDGSRKRRRAGELRVVR